MRSQETEMSKVLSALFIFLCLLSSTANANIHRDFVYDDSFAQKDVSVSLLAGMFGNVGGPQGYENVASSINSTSGKVFGSLNALILSMNNNHRME